MSAATVVPRQAHGSPRRLSCAPPSQGSTPEMLLMPGSFSPSGKSSQAPFTKGRPDCASINVWQITLHLELRVTQKLTLGWNHSVPKDSTFFFSSLLPVTRICLAVVCPHSAVEDLPYARYASAKPHLFSSQACNRISCSPENSLKQEAATGRFLAPPSPPPKDWQKNVKHLASAK